MGLHFPYIGYFKGRGPLSVRKDRCSTNNKEKERHIRAFFDFMKNADLTNCREFISNVSGFTPNECFKDILFEADLTKRPTFEKYTKIKGFKTLVIATWTDLFNDEPELIKDFALNSVKKHTPILCVDLPTSPLTKARLEKEGADLPFYLIKT